MLEEIRDVWTTVGRTTVVIWYCWKTGNGDLVISPGETWTCLIGGAAGHERGHQPANPHNSAQTARVWGSDQVFQAISKARGKKHKVVFCFSICNY